MWGLSVTGEKCHPHNLELAAPGTGFEASQITPSYITTRRGRGGLYRAGPTCDTCCRE